MGNASQTAKSKCSTQYIGGNLIASGSQLESFGNLRIIGGYLDFGGTKVTSYGNIKKIGGTVYFSGGTRMPKKELNKFRTWINPFDYPNDMM